VVTIKSQTVTFIHQAIFKFLLVL